MSSYTKSSYYRRSLALEKAAQEEERTWDVPEASQTRPEWGAQGLPTGPSALYGASGSEEKLFAYLSEKGYGPQRVSLTVPDLIDLPTDPKKTWVANPDIVCDHIVIEVDAPADRGGGPSHTDGFPAEDLYRDDCYRAAGYTVIRVRLHQLPPVPYAYNILRDGGLTNEILTYVADAINAIKKGKPLKNVEATPAKKRERKDETSLSPIVKSSYVRGDCHHFTYTHTDGRRMRLRLLCSGKYLYVHTDEIKCEKVYGSSPLKSQIKYVFLDRIDLDLADKQKARARLKEIIPAIIPQIDSEERSWSEFPFNGNIADILVTTGDEYSEPVITDAGYSTQVGNVLYETLLWVHTPSPVATWQEELIPQGDEEDDGETAHLLIHLFGENSEWLCAAIIYAETIDNGFQLNTVTATRSGAVISLTGPEINYYKE